MPAQAENLAEKEQSTNTGSSPQGYTQELNPGFFFLEKERLSPLRVPCKSTRLRSGAMEMRKMVDSECCHLHVAKLA